jgi:hypothetical protein
VRLQSLKYGKYFCGLQDFICEKISRYHPNNIFLSCALLGQNPKIGFAGLGSF